MPRRRGMFTRDVLPDPMYNSKVVTKFVNQIMWDGKKGTAQSIVYGAFDIIKEKTGMEPMEVFNKAMANVMPESEVKARRVGGSTYQVPIEIRPERRQTLAIRWIVINTRKRSEREMSKKLAAELDQLHPAARIDVAKILNFQAFRTPQTGRTDRLLFPSRSVDRLEALHHVDLLELRIHHQIDNHREEQRQERAVDKAQRLDRAPEHHHVDLHRLNDEGMHEHAERKAHRAAENRQKRRLAVNVARDLAVPEAEHLDRRQLALPLRHVDVRQVI